MCAIKPKVRKQRRRIHSNRNQNKANSLQRPPNSESNKTMSLIKPDVNKNVDIDVGDDLIKCWTTDPESIHAIKVTVDMDAEEIIKVVTDVQKIEFRSMLRIYNGWLSEQGLDRIRYRGITSAQVLDVIVHNVCPMCCNDGCTFECDICDRWYCPGCVQNPSESWICNFCVDDLE